MVTRTRLRRIPATLAAAVLLALSLTASPAFAADGNIDHVETTDDGMQVLFSIPGIGEDVSPDLDTLAASVNGQPLEASAALAADSSEGVQRTAVLAIDVSRSMRGERFEAAKDAAQAFLETAPLDVRVGIVTFAGDVEVAQEPTLNRAAAVDVLDDLELTLETRLYDGVSDAVRTAGSEGQRTVLVLSDGADTTEVPLADLTEEIRESKVQVDVVALAQSAKNRSLLEEIAMAGNGAVLDADDPAALARIFTSEAEALAKQVLVTATVPESVKADEATLAVTLEADGTVYTDSAYVAIRDESVREVGPGAPRPVAAGGFAVPSTFMLGGLVAAGLGGLVVMLAAFGVLSPRKPQTVEARIAAYSRSGAGHPQGRHGNGAQVAGSSGHMAQGMATSARQMAQKALDSNKGLEASLGAKLEAAGMSMKPAEWLLAQAGIAFGAALVGILLGNVLLAVLLLVLGLVVPYLYLGVKRNRRVKAFSNQLADTLQLMAGSLSAGLSLAQSVDTVVREGSEPITAEFKRALVEARLGVQIEDALESVAERMQSEDFRWVVMAVRIQREVGGNLAEVLNQVSATIRERAYLRRQVKTLSAEGVLSAWILGLLPVGVGLFLVVTRPTYLAPMVTSLFGWVLLLIAAVLMAVGTFWMRKLVKMEV